MNNTVLIVGGVAVLGGLAFYLYTKNKNQSAAAMMLPTSSPSASLPSGGGGGSNVSTPSTSYSAPTVKQTMWKDKDGHVFQMTTEKRKWGYHIKVDGGSNGELEVLKLMPDGYMIGADNNGSVFQFKNGKWNYQIKDNKAKAREFLASEGLDTSFLSGLAGMTGLGNAYVLN